MLYCSPCDSKEEAQLWLTSDTYQSFIDSCNSGGLFVKLQKNRHFIRLAGVKRSLVFNIMLAGVKIKISSSTDLNEALGTLRRS